MKVTYSQAVEHAATQFYMLRTSERKRWNFTIEEFDAAHQWMLLQRFTFDTETGITRNRNGWQGAFVNWDKSKANYENFPSSIFFDIFRGALMNKCSRIHRGIDVVTA